MHLHQSLIKKIMLRKKGARWCRKHSFIDLKLNYEFISLFCILFQSDDFSN